MPLRRFRLNNNKVGATTSKLVPTSHSLHYHAEIVQQQQQQQQGVLRTDAQHLLMNAG